jgi:hypothetical protein
MQSLSPWTISSTLPCRTPPAFEPARAQLPDAEFVVNGDDYGRARASDRPLLPLLSITRKVGRVGNDTLSPSHAYP